MHVGFTGTQHGMTASQKKTFEACIKHLVRREKEVVLHHGECIGADADADELCFNLGVATIGHPPEDKKKWWPYTKCIEHREAKPYRQRNIDIVRETEMLIAAPRTRLEELRSGTWMTVRIARKARLLIVFLDPQVPQEFAVERSLW